MENIKTTKNQTKKKGKKEKNDTFILQHRPVNPIVATLAWAKRCNLQHRC